MRRVTFLLSLLFQACVSSATGSPAEPRATTPGSPAEPRASTAGASPAAPEKPQPKPAWKRSCTEYARAPVSIDYEEAVGGAAVVYRTRGDVAALRARTREVADFHNSAKAKIGALHDLYSIPHRARVEEIEHGARLILVPKSVQRQQLEALRVTVQQQTFWLRRRGCGTGQEAL